MDTPKRRQISLGLMAGLEENLGWSASLPGLSAEQRPRTLVVWGPQDGYMPAASARAYLRDMPDAELHLVDGGHWALETNLQEIMALARDFLGRVHTS